MADQIFEGTFAPPIMGVGDTPIPLAGQGSLVITPEALVVKGYRGGGGGVAVLTFLVTTAAALGAAYAISVGLFHQAMSAGAAGGAIAAGVVSAVAMPRRASKIPWELAIPWRSVAKVTVHAQRKDVQLKIKKHKPRGTLHFKPTGEATQAVIEAIKPHLA